MVVAGLAGQFSWLCSYPFDVVKTIVQTSDEKLLMRDVFRENYQREGTRFFFKGFGPTLLRTFVVNMVILPTFDYLTINFVSKFAD
jgi:solute carrier family 25 (mitochondrial carnitine/acylcarnitine transporter), member 20/29